MKILISFTEHISFDLPQHDYIILSKFKSHSIKYGTAHKLIEDVHVDDKELLLEEEGKYNEYIANLPEDISEIFISSKTSLYFVIMALENWKIAVKTLVDEYQIDEVVFLELIDQNFYMPFYEAEGEVTKRLNYETYDFISIHLYNYIKANYNNINLTINKKRSNLKLRKRILIRRYGLFIIKILLQGWQYVKFYKFGFVPFSPTTEILFLSRGMAHSQYVVDYIKEFSSLSKVYFSDGLRTLGKNEQFLSKSSCSKNDCINSVKAASLYNFIKSVVQVTFILIKYKVVYERRLKFLDIRYKMPYSSSINEMIIHYLETHVYVSNLKLFLKKQKARNEVLPKVIITCEIYTQYTYFLAKLGKSCKIKTIQLISVAMNTGYLPQYFFCDRVLFNQKQILKNFQNKNQYLSYKCDYWGNLTFNELASTYKRKEFDEKLKVVFFSQPVIDEENDFIILSVLQLIKKNCSIDIFVKPHPRESPEKFFNYINDIQILSNTISLHEAVEFADVAIVKFSAVEHYLLNYGIPTIYCAFSQTAKNAISDIIKTGYKGIAFSQNDLISLVTDFPKLLGYYSLFRNDEMNRRFENMGLYSFHNSLLKFINE
ncbi:MAG: hypothetical protein ACOH2A_08950 [Sphingobacteriaceae bacterium]